MDNITIFSDCFSYHNGKPDQFAGYCIIAVNQNDKIIHTEVKAFDGCTNNYGELMGVLAALDYGVNLAQGTGSMVKQFEVISDSEYAILGARERIYKWVKAGWKVYGGKPLSNKILWEKIYEYLVFCTKNGIKPIFTHMDGHQGKSVTLNEDSRIYYQE